MLRRRCGGGGREERGAGKGHRFAVDLRLHELSSPIRPLQPYAVQVGEKREAVQQLVQQQRSIAMQLEDAHDASKVWANRQVALPAAAAAVMQQ
jgi:hypothetical protein